jgi:hypothetical protein
LVACLQLAEIDVEASDSCRAVSALGRGLGTKMVVILTFVTLVTGLLVTGYSLMFSSSAHARLSSLWVISGAALVAGGFLSAQMNGGRPYGFDIPIGLDQWKDIGPGGEEAPAKPQPQPRRNEDGTPMV